MATTTRRSLVGRAGAAARKVVARKSDGAGSTGSGAAKRNGTATTKKATTKKTAAKKSSPTTKKAATKPTKKAAAKKATATQAPAKKAATKTTSKAPAKKSVKKTAKKGGTGAQTTARGRGPAALVVREDESPWTAAELAEVRGQLREDVDRLTAELADVEEDVAGMMRNTGEGAGNDPADVGSASFERDQEMTIANNAREMLVQSEHALERIVDGSYGICESCGNPIGKNRLMVFPRATLCLSCKQREERR